MTKMTDDELARLEAWLKERCTDHVVQWVRDPVAGVVSYAVTWHCGEGAIGRTYTAPTKRAARVEAGVQAAKWLLKRDDFPLDDLYHIIAKDGSACYA